MRWVVEDPPNVVHLIKIRACKVLADLPLLASQTISGSSAGARKPGPKGLSKEPQKRKWTPQGLKNKGFEPLIFSFGAVPLDSPRGGAIALPPPHFGCLVGPFSLLLLLSKNKPFIVGEVGIPATIRSAYQRSESWRVRRGGGGALGGIPVKNCCGVIFE